MAERNARNAPRIEDALGQAVFVFGNHDSEWDDDYMHRFLALHNRCYVYPNSALVQFLVKISGAENVAELKAELINPKNYIHPFEMHYSSYAIDGEFLQYQYPKEK